MPSNWISIAEKYSTGIWDAVIRLFYAEDVASESAGPFSPPRDLRFEYGTFPFGRTARYRVRKGWVSRASGYPSQIRAGEAFRKRQPAADEWRDFWKAVEPLRIWDWKPTYFHPPESFPFVIDGQSWRFSCRSGERRVKSIGGRYYPKLWRPQETDYRYDAIALLKAALDELVAGPVRDGLPEISSGTQEDRFPGNRLSDD